MTPPARPLAGLTADAGVVRTAAFWAIIHGEPATVELIARRAKQPRSIVQRVLAQLEALGAITLDASTGAVTGSHGISASPAAYALTLAGRALSVWCAEDAVGIPTALGMDAQIEGRCAVCAAVMPITVKAGEVTRPGAEQVWLTEPVPGERTIDRL